MDRFHWSNALNSTQRRTNPTNVEHFHRFIGCWLTQQIIYKKTFKKIPGGIWWSWKDLRGILHIPSPLAKPFSSFMLPPSPLHRSHLFTHNSTATVSLRSDPTSQTQQKCAQNAKYTILRFSLNKILNFNQFNSMTEWTVNNKMILKESCGKVHFRLGFFFFCVLFPPQNI